MKSFLNPDTVANDVRMRRSVFKGSFLVVEGYSDQKFFKNVVNDLECQVVAAFGRHSVLRVCDILRHSGTRGYLGIVDGDFNEVMYSFCRRSDLCITDDHDIECLYLKGKAFEKVLNELGSEEKVKSWKNIYRADLKTHLLQQAVQIGLLLHHSNICGLGLCFDDLDPSDYLDETSLVLDKGHLVDHVKNKSLRHDLPSANLVVDMGENLIHNLDAWKVVRGKDIISMLSFALRRTIGSRKASDVSSEILERLFRVAFPTEEFINSRLYESIKRWEGMNVPFKVLAF